MNPSRPTPPPLQAVLANSGTQQRRRRWLLLLLLSLTAGAAVVGWRWQAHAQAASVVRYNSSAATLGDLTVKVAATGNLQPTNQVDVGSEISGTVAQVLVDENDQVHKGQVLARLDTVKLGAQAERSRSTLAAAEARVLQSAATLQEATANLNRLKQLAMLSGGKIPAATELDSAEATLQRAKADLASAKASVQEARAALTLDETSLRKATIISPIDGVVLTRSVEPGQTVAASLQAPVLFTLAEDLTKMQLQVYVDEADVGQVRAGQPASFQVDAYPKRQFPASITRVGLGSQTKDGVVSYKTILDVGNDDLSLRPGMTATAEITTVTRQHVLLVANAALRFSPPAAPTANGNKGSLLSNLLPRPPRELGGRPGKSVKAKGMQQVWVLRAGKAEPVNVRLGVSNGEQTEILDGDLQAGDAVITDLATGKGS